MKRMMNCIENKFVVAQSLSSVNKRIEESVNRRPKEYSHFTPRLVAVSKLKPVELIIEAYQAGQRYFGENYVQELYEKSNNQTILEICTDIKWHFIGHLQGNKAKKVVQECPNLFMIETIDSEKLASSVNKLVGSCSNYSKLPVMVQVNTSAETNKNGKSPDEVDGLVSHILSSCPNLTFKGLMTIGSFNHDLTLGPNPDFQTLIACKEKVCQNLHLDPQNVELSMGMSNDFEHAIENGSSNVRVGSTIFGQREPKSTPQLNEPSSSS